MTVNGLELTHSFLYTRLNPVDERFQRQPLNDDGKEHHDAGAGEEEVPSFKGRDQTIAEDRKLVSLDVKRFRCFRACELPRWQEYRSICFAILALCS